jgi:hypothetical protein
MADFLDTKVRFPEPPALAAPSDLLSSERGCDTHAPHYDVLPNPPATKPRRTASRRLTLHFGGRRDSALLVELATTPGTLTNVSVELLRSGHLVARASVRRLGARTDRVLLRRGRGRRFAPGHYVLRVRHRRTVLAQRDVTVH